MSTSTWHADSSREIDAKDLLHGMRDWWPTADGLTISGGEPLDQSAALRELLALSRNVVRGDILLYSGYSVERIERDWPWVFDAVDVLISEPYIAAQRPGPALRGSRNQRLHRLSPLGVTRYPVTLDEARDAGDAVDIQAIRSNDEWFVAGVPSRELIGALKRGIRADGYTLEASPS